MHWCRRAVSLLHHSATDLKVLMGIWRVTRSARLQDLFVRRIFVFVSTFNGIKLVDALGGNEQSWDGMGMEEEEDPVCAKWV
eukprot:1161771-Pelagomonas_calceolata.AAC.3